jgi:hypothetical protein
MDNLQNLHVAFGIDSSGNLVILHYGHNQQSVNESAFIAVNTGGCQLSAAFCDLKASVTYQGSPAVGTTEEASPDPGTQEPALVP